MKRCINCKHSFESSLSTCPDCGSEPVIVNNFCSYAPDAIEDGTGFKPSYFEQLAQLEKNNFWFTSRNKLIIWAIQKFFPDFQSLLEVGCGTGFVLSGIASAFPSVRLVGSELFLAGLPFASARLPRAQLIQMDARDIPYTDEFDVVTAFDVLEHIAEDDRVLANLHRAVKPGGGLLVTVPQHQCLWSITDDHACHVRRYDAEQLHTKITTAGFSIVRSTSFLSLLLPVMALSRRRGQSGSTFDPMKELQISPLLNRILEGILHAERAMIKTGLNFPAGGSRLVVAKKPTKEQTLQVNC